MKALLFIKSNKWIVLFLSAYFIYLLLTLNPFYLDSDEGSYALTALFYNRLINDWSLNPSLSPSSLLDYATAYYARYPKFMFLNGPFYMLINAFFAGFSVLLLKLGVVVLSVLTLALMYFIFKRLFGVDAGLIALLITATSSIYVNASNRFLTDIPSLFFFTLGFYYFLSRKASVKYSVFSGVCFGLSVLVKDVSLPYVGIVCLFIFSGFRKYFKNNIALLGSLCLVLLPYIVLIVASGGLDVFLSYPSKQLWYVERQGDPQWYDFAGWFYFPSLIVNGYSFIALPLLLIGLYYVYVKGDRRVFYFILISFLIVTVMSDKADRRLLQSILFTSGVIGYAVSVIYSRISSISYRAVFLFIIVLMIIIQLPVPRPNYNIPMSEVADYLVNECPDCTVLIASESGSAYSSYLMYESMVRDVNESLRFIRPAVFYSRTAAEVINSERVNRVIVIGDKDFIDSSVDVNDYRSEVEYIMNKYSVVKFYPSELVGAIIIYDTGISDVKEAPFCASSPSMGKDFCTVYNKPVYALRA